MDSRYTALVLEFYPEEPDSLHQLLVEQKPFSFAIKVPPYARNICHSESCLESSWRLLHKITPFQN